MVAIVTFQTHSMTVLNCTQLGGEFLGNPLTGSQDSWETSIVIISALLDRTTFQMNHKQSCLLFVWLFAFLHSVSLCSPRPTLNYLGPPSAGFIGIHHPAWLCVLLRGRHWIDADSSPPFRVILGSAIVWVDSDFVPDMGIQ